VQILYELVRPAVLLCSKSDLVPDGRIASNSVTFERFLVEDDGTKGVIWRTPIKEEFLHFILVLDHCSTSSRTIATNATKNDKTFDLPHEAMPLFLHKRTKLVFDMEASFHPSYTVLYGTIGTVVW